MIMKLQEDIEDIEVVIKFNASPSNKSIWCDNIELFIDYDIFDTLPSSGFRVF
jgi:hypothetical protein